MIENIVVETSCNGHVQFFLEDVHGTLAMVTYGFPVQESRMVFLRSEASYN